MFRTLATSLGALVLAAPLAALPVAAFAQDVPSYAQSAEEAPGDQQLRGRIVNFDGGYNVTVRDERGYIDNVELHPGTIINPTGLTLAPGMTVSILGYNAGDAFAANEIDTPYEYQSGVPYYSGHPWNYYGSGISLAFFFGNPGWWHGNDFHGGYRYYGGARYYNDVHIRNVYNYNRGGGSFHGRAFVAPAEHGGYYRGTRNESVERVQRNVTVERGYDARTQQQTRFAGPPIEHRYASPQVENVRYQNRSAAVPQYHNEARSQYQNEARPQYRNDARPQSRSEARPQYQNEARPQYHSEARPVQSRGEARPVQSRSEARPQGHSEGHDHGGGRPH